MTITIYRISDRQDAYPVEVRHQNQFTLVDPNDADESVVLAPNWSLYCLNIEGGTALFVELPESVDLALEPFYYAAQFKYARRAAFVSLQSLPLLAAKADTIKNVALLMSTGRCGSTLVSRMFAQIPGVWSLSEPDWCTNLAFDRHNLQDQQIQTLIQAAIALTCRPPKGKHIDKVVIKPRSEMLIQAPAYISALKGSQAIFLYRDCLGYVNSLYRFAQRVQGVKDPLPGSDAWEFGRQLCMINAPIADLQNYFSKDEDVQLSDLMALGWFLRMQAYLNASAGGMTVAALHYDDLNSDKKMLTSRLLESCGISHDFVTLAMTAFETDAHQGSSGENTIPAAPITLAQRLRVQALLKRWGAPDFASERLPSSVD